MYFHLSRGQPVMPSLVRYHLYELHVTLNNCVVIETLSELASLGLNIGSFCKLLYSEREQEYPRTQEIAEAAFFHTRQGTAVPSARSEHPNLVVFCDRSGPDAVEVVKDHGEVDWATRRKNSGP